MTDEVKISRRQQKRLEKMQEPESHQIKWVQIRMFPIWLRILLVIILFAIAAVAGLMIGYGVIGEGTPKDALNWSTYQHILDIKDGK